VVRRLQGGWGAGVYMLQVFDEDSVKPLKKTFYVRPSSKSLLLSNQFLKMFMARPSPVKSCLVYFLFLFLLRSLGKDFCKPLDRIMFASLISLH
jgi:hypothetical protein